MLRTTRVPPKRTGGRNEVRTHYQNGSIRRRSRKQGDYWEFLWWERREGKRVRRSQSLGTVEELRTKAEAEKRAQHLRIDINRGHALQEAKLFGAVIDKYIAEEMPQRFSTAKAYKANIENHIRPRWGSVEILKVRPIEVRNWLRGSGLSPKTQGHLKALLGKLFSCAMLWEWIPQAPNPMELVRIEGVTKRQRKPRVLTLEQFNRLLAEIPEEPFRTMVLTDMCLGLRCSELLALQWQDIDFDELTITLRRAIVHGRIGDMKTEASQDPLPLDPALAEALLRWKRMTEFSADPDWVWASPFQAGEKPYLSWGVQQRHIRPAAEKAGLGVLGWHALRHTYRSWLDATGAQMAVQQKLMRHADIRTTMNVYGDALEATKREANSKVVKMVIPVAV